VEAQGNSNRRPRLEGSQPARLGNLADNAYEQTKNPRLKTAHLYLDDIHP
jgi:hypothetical protein